MPKKHSPGNPDNYTWTHDEFSECSVTCGGGKNNKKKDVNKIKKCNNN